MAMMPDEWRLWRCGDVGFAQAIRDFLEWNPNLEAEDLYRELHAIVGSITVRPDEISPAQMGSEEDRRAMIQRLWLEGKRLPEIARLMGWRGTKGVQSRITAMRRDGWDMPYRRPDLAEGARSRAAAMGDRLSDPD